MNTTPALAAMTRLTMLGQVALIGWFVPLVVAGAFLQGSLGHVSGIVLAPLACQALVGALMHGTLVVRASPKAISSLGLAIGVGVLATCSVVAGSMLAGDSESPNATEQLVRVGAVLLVVAVCSSVLGNVIVRRELRSPSLG